jgi:predicted NUDIX family NTP pyrophosphohydrolase
MPYHHISNFNTPEAATAEARRLNKRTGVSIQGFRTVLGKYKPGSTKSEMDRAQEADKKLTDMRDGNIVTRIGENVVMEEPNYYHKMGWFSAKDGSTHDALPHEKYHADILKRKNLDVNKHRLVRYWTNKKDGSFGVDWGSANHKKPLSATELRKIQGFIRNHPHASKKVEVHPSMKHDNSTSMVHDNAGEAIRHISKIIAHRMTRDEEVGLYSNSTPINQNRGNWNIDKDYIVSESVPSLRDVKNMTEETQPLSRLAELKSFTKRFGWNLKMTNIRDEMIFSKNGMDLFILPEPEMLKSYNSGLKGYLSGPVKSIWYQWKLVVGDKNHYGLTAIELKNTINSIVR